MSMTRPWRSEVRAVNISATISSSVVGGEFDGARQRIAAKRAEPHQPHLAAFSPARSFMRSSSTMMSAPSRSTTGRSCREIKRHDRDVLHHDVLPDVELGPVRQRKHADGFALVRCACCRRAKARAAGSSDPRHGWRCGTRRCAPSRAIFSSSRRAPPKAASKPYLSSACFSPSVFITCVCRAEPESNGLMPRFTPSSLMWTSSLSPSRFAVSSRNLIISRNFQVVSTCRSGNGGLRRIERLHRQMQHHRRILADGIEHHRIGELGRHLAHDVDALRLEALEVGEAVGGNGQGPVLSGWEQLIRTFCVRIVIGHLLGWR